MITAASWFKCSVIIPAHNSGMTLAEAIRSVLSQSRLPLELIVVDDGSSDNSTEVFHCAVRNAAIPCRLITLEACNHAGKARNLGVREATGNFVAFLDSDDAWNSNHLESAAEAFRQFPEAVAYGSRVEIRIETEWTERGRVEPPGDGYPGESPSDIYCWLLAGNSVWNTTLCIRKSVFLDAGGYHESLRCYEDVWMTMNVARIGLFVLSNNIGCLVRTRRRSLSGQADKDGRVFMSPSMYSDRLALSRFSQADPRFTGQDTQAMSAASCRFVSENFAGLCRARAFGAASLVLKAVASRLLCQPRLSMRVLSRAVLQTMTTGCHALILKLIRLLRPTRPAGRT